MQRPQTITRYWNHSKKYGVQYLGRLIDNQALAAVALGLIRFYQYVISPLFGPACRFHPTCSHYAFQAISRYGFIKGTVLSVKRLLRCHPFHPGGFDPVP